MSVKLPGHADFATVASESTFQLAAGTLKERGFHLDNPSFGVKNHEFRCVAGEEGEVLEIRGVPPDELSISITESVRPYRPLYGERKDDQMVTAAPLDGNVQPEYGTLLEAKGWKPAAGPEGQPNTAIELDGAGGMIKYKIVGFPNEQFTVSIWVSVTAFPKQGRIGQVFSAWWAGNDDPLRLVVDSSKLAARIEAGKEYSTEGVALEIGRWYHVAGVKQDNQLTLYIDGRVRLTTAAPRALSSGAECFALGGNPCSATSPELLAARMAGLKFYARALGIEEVKKLSEAGQVKGK